MITGESGIRMPPEDDGAALSDAQIALIKQWIDEGAHAPPETPPPDPRDHWAYQPPVRPTLPASSERSRGSAIRSMPSSPPEHESHGLTPVSRGRQSSAAAARLSRSGRPAADARGAAAFLADESPERLRTRRRRLLASPQYGERWARHWMDVWRYSDWSGYKQEIRDSARHIWRWRDWIVESLNADKGYDRMVVEMLAGDELAPGDREHAAAPPASSPATGTSSTATPGSKARSSTRPRRFSASR